MRRSLKRRSHDFETMLIRRLIESAIVNQIMRVMRRLEFGQSEREQITLHARIQLGLRHPRSSNIRSNTDHSSWLHSPSLRLQDSICLSVSTSTSRCEDFCAFGTSANVVILVRASILTSRVLTITQTVDIVCHTPTGLASRHEQSGSTRAAARTTSDRCPSCSVQGCADSATTDPSHACSGACAAASAAAGPVIDPRSAAATANRPATAAAATTAAASWRSAGAADVGAEQPSRSSCVGPSRT